MKTIKIISNSQIIKANWIDDYMYAYELKGGFSQIFKTPGTPEYHSQILVQRGTLHYIFNGNEVEVRQGELINIPSWSQIIYIKYSADFMGMLIAVNNSLILDIFRNRNPFPPSLRFKVRDINNLQLSARECRIIAHDMSNLLGALGNKEHHFAKELNYAHYYIFLTDIANTIWKIYGEGDLPHSLETSRSEKLLKEFIVLVEANIEKVSNVGFYADALCISKQYLSLIIKQQIHIPAGKFLERLRFEKAASLLLDTSLSVQQVADRLAFPDQSSFGKFFKKHGGKSPLAYRKEQNKNLLSMREDITKDL